MKRTSLPLHRRDFIMLLGGTAAVYPHRADPGCLRLRKPRALPRVMLLTDWRIADFDWLIANRWPSDVDPRRTVLLKGAPMISAHAWISLW
jgi:hypothetical protein